MFSTIIANMVTYLQTAGSKLSDFTATSILGQILSAIASAIDEIYTAITSAQQQAYVQTATDTSLDAKGADFGVTRKQATPAQWYFTFSRNVVSNQQQPIPAGTIITTIPSLGQDPITFATDADSFLGAGTLTVTVSATCQTAGSVGNIAINTPLLIGSGVPGIDGVQLLSLTNGTYGADTETDDAYRSRILAALASKAQGTVSWYQQTALTVTGVQSAKIVPQGRGSGTIDIYVVASGNAMPSQSLISSVQAAIDAGRIITDDAKVFSPTQVTVNRTINIHLASGYDPTVVTGLVQTAVSNYINSLGIGGGSLGELYESQVIKAALSVNGVVNATSADTDVSFSAYQLPQAGTITVTVV
ncbi:baseplate J/gp47 family protein [Bacillus sp. BRMEA1]|uniref:baseplate J/gp47 family protein n=1 Tax=Neobacillus endophyticus TaxID=2738405 RepID=UPI0015657517|nr:baseplate J/gp47 family protein [Neobacillus endophyticus]NRD80277.1 baseplate J/gp47 family protein [Neobacillus endophyticus]